MECRMISQFLIAAPSSGSGKTTVSRGLMALLIKKGLKVQPFKCGPDTPNIIRQFADVLPSIWIPLWLRPDM